MGTGTSIWNMGALAIAALLALSACGGAESTVDKLADPIQTLGLQPTFESLSAKVFQPKCAGCHKGTGANAPVIAWNQVPVFFESEQQLMMAGDIVPGEPAESPLFIRVTLPPGSFGRMPAGALPLSAGELEAIRAWIAGLGSNGIILTPGGGG